MMPKFVTLHDPRGREIHINPETVVSICHVIEREAPENAVTQINHWDGKFQYVREHVQDVKSRLESA
jgi:hypothetical protein